MSAHCCLSVFKGAYQKTEREFLPRNSDRTKGKSFKLKEGRFTLAIRKIFSTVKGVRHWHKLLTEVVDAQWGPVSVENKVVWGF